MGSGGARLGAGRPLSTPPAPKFDLVDRLRREPSGSRGLQRRVVIAMASYGADAAEIAAALGLEEELMLESFAEQLDIGRLICSTNIISQIFRRATANGSAWSFSAARWFLRRHGWDDQPTGHQRTPRAA